MRRLKMTLEIDAIASSDQNLQDAVRIAVDEMGYGKCYVGKLVELVRGDGVVVTVRATQFAQEFNE